MRDATCKTCPFWVPHRRTKQEPEGGSVDDGPSDLGHCHHATAGNDPDPTRNETWWCSEHPLRHRHRLAAAAMQGILANPNTPETWDPAKIAAWAYEQADAMLATAGEGP